MTTEHGYNGWRNHATWAIGLHLIDTVVDWIVDDVEEWANDSRETNIDNAAQLFKDLLDEQIDHSDLVSFPLLMDLLDNSDIDWRSLGEHALDAAEVPILECV